MKNYRNLFVWQDAHALVLTVYRLTKKFPKDEQYNLISQLRRAATSIPTNIAEGCGKFTQADFVRYLQIALGSTQEVEYLIFLSLELGYLKSDDFEVANDQVKVAKAKLINLVMKVRRENQETKRNKSIKK